MNCPNCHKPVKDGTAICPNCDHIIDASFLGDVNGDPEGEATLPPKPREQRPTTKPPQRAAPKPAPKPTPPPANRWAKYAEQQDEEEDTRGLPPKGGATKPGPAIDLEPSDPGSANAQLEGLFNQFKALCFEDKVTVISAALVALMIFMPWRSTAEDGDVLGILGISGITCMAFAIGSVASVLGRVGNYISSLPRNAFPIVSVMLGGLSALTALVSGVSFIDNTKVRSPLGSMIISNSSPSFGVWLTVVCSAGVVLGGILTFKRVRAEG